MVEAYVSTLERLVSTPRLDRYRASDGHDLETLVSYFCNIAYAEALLQTISAVEVALRNSIHSAFTVYADTEQWFWKILKKNDLEVVMTHWMKLAQKLNEPPSAGKVIAELSFGFWPYLFEHRYNGFWRNDQERLLRNVFPHRPVGGSPSDQISPAVILKRLVLFRDLRNRVMHHEPVIFGIPRPDEGTPPPVVSLSDAHTQMVEMLDWIDPHWVTMLSLVDRFPEVLLNEADRLRSRLRVQLGHGVNGST